MSERGDTADPLLDGDDTDEAIAAPAESRHDEDDRLKPEFVSAVLDAVEYHAVVEALVRQFGDALNVFRRKVGPQLDDDVAAFPVAGIEGEGQFFGGHSCSPVLSVRSIPAPI
jgi:hypothetical protein